MAKKVPSRSLPFAELPNLPKAKFNPIDLGIIRRSIGEIRPSLTDNLRIGFFKSDQATQTDESDIVELKRVSITIGALVKDIMEVRKDLNTTLTLAKRDYQQQIDKRADELYSHANARVNELEKIHLEKIEIIRKSYRSQLSNAIAKIAGEYKVYYDDLMKGKTGRHDARIKELKRQVETLEARLEESDSEVLRLREALELTRKGLDEEGVGEEGSGPELSGLTRDEEHTLRMNIVNMEGELDAAQTQLAEKDDIISKLRRQSEQFERQFEAEKGKVQQLKVDIETIKQRGKKEREKAEKLARTQRESLEKEYSERMVKAEKAALAKASEEAELQRMRDVAKFQQELESRQSIEAELRKQAAESRRVTTTTIPEGELATELEKWRKKSMKQEAELVKVKKELDRTNQVWNTKLSIMQRNFHALKDESYLRHRFQRQSALLHYATVGYAPTNLAPPPLQIHAKLSAVREDDATYAPPVPTPTPIHAYHSSMCEESVSPGLPERPKSALGRSHHSQQELQTPA